MIIEVRVVDPVAEMLSGFTCPNGHEVTQVVARAGQPVRLGPCGCLYEPTDIWRQQYIAAVHSSIKEKTTLAELLGQKADRFGDEARRLFAKAVEVLER